MAKSAKQLSVGPGFKLPLDAVTEPIAILAVRRAGKSNAGVVLAEEMFAARLHWVAFDPKGDWWGMRSSSDGKGKGLPVPIFGGLHGDIPLEPTSGALVADMVVDQRLTCILDLSEFESDAAKIRFQLGFCDRLWRRKNANQEPTHIFMEEADDSVPQKPMREQTRLLNVVTKIVKQGGSRGLGYTVISQRAAVVNKDVLSQCQTLIALRSTYPNDRDAIKRWVSYNGESPEVINDLPGLADGEAWIWSPNWLRIKKRVKFRRRRTFDSGRTPKVGESRKAPATLVDVDLGKLREAMAASIERAEQEDPKALKKRIAELEKQNRRLEAQAKKVEPPTVIRETSLPDGAAELVNDALEKLTRLQSKLRRPIAKTVAPRAALNGVAAQLKTNRKHSNGIQAMPISQGSEPIGKGERTVLVVLCQSREGATKRQIRTMTGYKRSSVDAYLQRLRSTGLAEQQDDRHVGTEAGKAALGSDYEPLPTGRALAEYWLQNLPQGERVVLRKLLGAGGPVDHETLREQTVFARSSLDAYLQRLRSRELVNRVSLGVSEVNRELTGVVE